jgi:sugar/nucleoside kinase (ribokinase family)
VWGSALLQAGCFANWMVNLCAQHHGARKGMPMLCFVFSQS